MVFEDFQNKKLIDKDFLYEWLVKEVVNAYRPGLDSFEFGGEQRIVKILKFLKFQSDGSLLVSISDSNHSILAVISSRCIINYERNQKCRITEHTTNTLVLIRHVKLSWLNKFQFQTLIQGLSLRYGDVRSFAIVQIDELEIFDADQTEILVQLESVYTTPEYKKCVKPYKVKEGPLRCL